MSTPTIGVHERIERTIGPVRGPAQVFVDVAAWAIGLVAAMWLRFELSFDSTAWGSFSWTRVLSAIGIACAFQIAVGLLMGLYRGQYRYGSFDEVIYQTLAVITSSLGLAVVNQALDPQLVPTSVVIIGGILSLVIMCAVRYVWRLSRERSMRPSTDKSERVLVFGAGEGGLQVITAMLRNPRSPYFPVALIDDNPIKRNLRINGVRVVGTRQIIARAAREHHASSLLIAIPSASPELIRELSEIALEAKLQVKVLPPLTELFEGTVGVGDIRPITEADLLGRHAIDTDIESIAQYLAGKRVLVTGAGGSIGSELCYQIARFAPAELVMLDRDESALHGVQLRLDGRALLDSPNLVVASIRDPERMLEVFEVHKPAVVFHAAALKHLPLLETHPKEALKTNVFGTHNVLKAANAVGVERFVNISTDKAADPTSVLGYTKRISEMLTADMAAKASGVYLSVRFGNVLGSRGSVLTTFRAQIDGGGPITVTHPDVTRYFMTIEEAVQLVIQAGAIGRDGEALVLDMGEPVRIDDVARRLAAEAERNIDIVYTGLRPGEKLNEILLGAEEVDQRPLHPLISHVSVARISMASITSAIDPQHQELLIEQLQRLSALSDPGVHGSGPPPA